MYSLLLCFDYLFARKLIRRLRCFYSVLAFGTVIYINGKYKYAANEILTAHLNTEYLSAAKELRTELY